MAPVRAQHYSTTTRWVCKKLIATQVAVGLGAFFTPHQTQNCCDDICQNIGPSLELAKLNSKATKQMLPRKWLQFKPLHICCSYHSEFFCEPLCSYHPLAIKKDLESWLSAPLQRQGFPYCYLEPVFRISSETFSTQRPSADWTFPMSRETFEMTLDFITILRWLSILKI